MWQVPQFLPGELLTAAKLNQLSEIEGALLTSRFASGAIGSFGILTADQLSESFWARITDNDAGSPPAHSWVQVIETEAKVYETQGGGMYGDKVNLPLFEINGSLITNGTIVRIWRGQGDYYLCELGLALAWVETQSSVGTATTIHLGRQILDGQLTNGSPTLVSNTANFTSEDVGSTVTGTDIPATTTITAVDSSTSVTLSNNATGSGTGITVTIDTGHTIQGFVGVVVTFDDKTGTWNSGETDWLYPVNGETPTPNKKFQCRKLGTDYHNVAIWGTVIDEPTSWFAAVTSLTSQIITVSLPGGSQSVSVYPAVVSTYDSAGDPHSSGTQNAWLLFNAAAGTPFYQYRYACFPIGTAASGNLPVYMTDDHSPFSQVETPSAFTPDPNDSIAALGSIVASTVSSTPASMCPLLFGPNYIVVGNMPGIIGGSAISFPANPSIYIGAGNPLGSYTVYQGATGTDSSGSQFVGGVCVTVGSNSSTPSVIDGGSDW